MLIFFFFSFLLIVDFHHICISSYIKMDGQVFFPPVPHPSFLNVSLASCRLSSLVGLRQMASPHHSFFFFSRQDGSFSHFLCRDHTRSCGVVSAKMDEDDVKAA